MRPLLVALLGLVAVSSVAHADFNRRIRLINDTNRSIVEFHASNVGTNSWEEDILGRNVLAPGNEVTINLNDGSGYCKFDFLTVMRGGQQVVKRNVNICEIESYRIYE